MPMWDWGYSFAYLSLRPLNCDSRLLLEVSGESTNNWPVPCLCLAFLLGDLEAYLHRQACEVNCFVSILR